jgi:hypothetical protein
MPLFTLDVQGRPVLVFLQQDRDAATELVSSTIAPDLLELEEDGSPVWDGEGELSVRDASPGETSQWEDAFGQALEDGDATEADREGYAVFLIEVDDLEDEDEPDRE